MSTGLPGLWVQGWAVGGSGGLKVGGRHLGLPKSPSYLGSGVETPGLGFRFWCLRFRA